MKEQLEKHNAAIQPFVEAFGGMDSLEKRVAARGKRKAQSSPSKTTSSKRGKTDKSAAIQSEDPPEEEVAQLFEDGKLQKLTVVKLKAYCARHGLPAEGKKADLLHTVSKFLESKA